MKTGINYITQTLKCNATTQKINYLSSHSFLNRIATKCVVHTNIKLSRRLIGENCPNGDDFENTPILCLKKHCKYRILFNIHTENEFIMYSKKYLFRTLLFVEMTYPHHNQYSGNPYVPPYIQHSFQQL